MIPTIREAARALSSTQAGLVLFGLLGAALVIQSTSLNGVGISPDSVVYISTADSVLDGNGYTTYLDEPLVSWPPLYPTLLAFLGFVGVDSLDSARAVNAVVFGLIVLLAGQLFRHMLRSSALTLLGACSVLLSWPLIQATTFALTDALFALLALFTVLYMPRVLLERRLAPLILLSAIVSLAWLLRYAGAGLFITGIVSIALLLQGANRREKFQYLLIYTLIAVTPITVWLIRNYLLTSTTTGRGGGAASFSTQIE
jgi:hypothetical protein